MAGSGLYSSNSEIIRGITCLSMIQIPHVMKFANVLMKTMSKTKATTALMNSVMRMTMFKQFCGGEDLMQLKQKLESLEANGVGGVVDYAAEAPLSSSMGGGVAQDFDTCVNRTTDAIKFLRHHTKYPYLATKMTGFMTTDDLFQASEVVRMGREAYRCLASGQNDMGAQFALPLDFQMMDSLQMTYETVASSMKGSDMVSHSQFKDLLNLTRSLKFKPSDALHEFISWGDFENCIMDFLMTRDKSSHPLMEFLKPIYDLRNKLDGDLRDLKSISVSGGNARLLSVLDVLRENVATPSEVNECTPLVVMDAEESAFQPAIDLMTNHHSLRCNSEGQAIFANTYQLYLKDGYSRIAHDFSAHRMAGVPFGAKLVRGAYMTSEARHCLQRGRPQVVNNTIEETHDAYNRSAKFCVEKCFDDEMKVIFGTHNEESCRIISETVKDIAEVGRVLPFGNLAIGQLKGMSDSLTMRMVEASKTTNILPIKYVPYGPVELVMPYLIRRMEENSNAISRVHSDVRYLRSLIQF
eukprot:GHVH01017364.1.p1 GENE.GHVH01017364.1~~GHVH01017364.1.p1  ORF type:complete len:525 (-),score=76.36 GHVH01017364.1:188-1762(-)